MSLRFWSTDDVQPRLRKEYWIDAIGHSLARSEIDIPDAVDFQAKLLSGNFGPLRMSRTVVNVGRTVRRTRHNIAVDSRDCYHLVTSNHGAWSVHTERGPVGQQGDDAVLLSSGREYAIQLQDESDLILIGLPVSWVEGWICQADDHVGQRIDASSGWARVLCAFIKQMFLDFQHSIPQDASALTNELGALAGRALNPPSEVSLSRASARSSARSSELAEKILSCIRDRHRETNITAAEIAADLGMSIRSLHRHLATLGISMSQSLMQTRIESAKYMLMSRAFRNLSVAEIGHRCGYNDASHFVKQFRRSTAMTPGRFRKGTLSEC
ncbi:helix-turn-helix domain-containing protein [Cupriavidus pampae]|uniref:Transcriptional activator FeaR n=1 Tax=Cupriavidus pampae TaxID=659251 RepID=A0ABM8WU11_9BURK|nr:AraC family transcriptional regulator [Cupriavidus pampae]CAG9170961.1 Transcriptional activator FeaR [Cupriavidus pampae]